MLAKILLIISLISPLCSDEILNIQKPEIVWMHNGNEKLNIPRLRYEIYEIAKKLPNIRYTKDLSHLVIETLAIETNLGQFNYLKNDHKTRNYGLGQFVPSTVKYILKVCKKDEKLYTAIMSYYDHKLSLIDNVRYNVKFTIALQLEYYVMCDKDVHSHISTVRDRAHVWKKHYNTYKGAGTVLGYIKSAKTRI